MIARLGAARILAGALATVMALWLWQALRLKYTAANGQPGPGAWPVWLTLLGLVLAMAIIVVETRSQQAKRRRAAQPSSDLAAASPDAAADQDHATPAATHDADGEEGSIVEEEGRGTILRPLGALAGMVAFLLLMPVLGFQLGLAAFLLFLNLVLIRMPWPLGIAITVVLMVLVNLIFARFFNVPFPKSVLGF